MVRCNVQKHPHCTGGDHNISASTDNGQDRFKHLIFPIMLLAEQDEHKIDQADKQELEKALSGISAVAVAVGKDSFMLPINK